MDGFNAVKSQECENISEGKLGGRDFPVEPSPCIHYSLS